MKGTTDTKPAKAPAAEWKRIQTLMMGAATLLLLVMLGSEMCYAMVPSDGGSDLVRYPILFRERLQFLLFILITAGIALVATLGFRLRMIQIRLCIIDAIVLLAFQAWIVVEFFKMHGTFTFTVYSVFPIVAALLLLLSIKFTWKDEARAIVDRAFAQHAAKSRGQQD